MASEKQVVLIFSMCDGAALAAAKTPALEKLFVKGAALTNVAIDGDVKARASIGAKEGETLWDAAAKAGFRVADYKKEHDMAVVEAGASAAAVEEALAGVLEVSGRTTIVALVARGLVVFYGPGFAKGKKIEKAVQPEVVAATVPYVADFPVPEQCEAAVCYAALKDVNYKLKEIQKLQTTIANIESALEAKTRKPWDKHDCA